MNWEAVIAITEVAGLLVVVASLVYISIQSRQAQQHAKAATEISFFSYAGSQMDAFTANDASVSLFRRGLADFHELEKSEKAIFASRMMSLLRLSVLSELLSRKGLLGPAVTEEAELLWLSATKSKGGRQFLEEFGKGMPGHSEFREQVYRKSESLPEVADLFPWLAGD